MRHVHRRWESPFEPATGIAPVRAAYGAATALGQTGRELCGQESNLQRSCDHPVNSRAPYHSAHHTMRGRPCERPPRYLRRDRRHRCAAPVTCVRVFKDRGTEVPRLRMKESNLLRECQKLAFRLGIPNESVRPEGLAPSSSRVRAEHASFAPRPRVVGAPGVAPRSRRLKARPLLLELRSLSCLRRLSRRALAFESHRFSQWGMAESNGSH